MVEEAKINWRIHGSEFPALLYIAAYTLVGASFTKMPRHEDFVKGSREVDGFEIWGALRRLYAWFRLRCDSFPFSRPEIFYKPRDVDIAELASCLFEMTQLHLERHLPPENRKPARHYGTCDYHLGRYMLTLQVFLNHLYDEVEFDDTPLGREEQIIRTMDTLLGKIKASMPFIAAVNEFASLLRHADKIKFALFLRDAMVAGSGLTEDEAHRLVAEFKKQNPEAMPSA